MSQADSGRLRRGPCLGVERLEEMDVTEVREALEATDGLDVPDEQ